MDRLNRGWVGCSIPRDRPSGILLHGALCRRSVALIVRRRCAIACVQRIDVEDLEFDVNLLRIAEWLQQRHPRGFGVMHAIGRLARATPHHQGFVAEDRDKRRRTKRFEVSVCRNELAEGVCGIRIGRRQYVGEPRELYRSLLGKNFGIPAIHRRIQVIKHRS